MSYYEDSNLEINGTWVVQSGPTVNPVAPDAFFSQVVNGALQVYIISSKAFGGALVTCKRPVPIVGGVILPYVGLDFDTCMSAEAVAFMRNRETDLKICVSSAPNSSSPIINVANGSVQLSLAEGGMFQIDNAASTWTDTGYKPGIPLPEQWTHVSIRYFLDLLNSKYSVLSIVESPVGTGVIYAPFLIPTNLQGFSDEDTNWTQIAAVQFQLDNNSVPAAFSVQFKNVALSFSSVPF